MKPIKDLTPEERKECINAFGVKWGQTVLELGDSVVSCKPDQVRTWANKILDQYQHSTWENVLAAWTRGLYFFNLDRKPEFQASFSFSTLQNWISKNLQATAPTIEPEKVLTPQEIQQREKWEGTPAEIANRIYEEYYGYLEDGKFLMLVGVHLAPIFTEMMWSVMVNGTIGPIWKEFSQKVESIWKNLIHKKFGLSMDELKDRTPTEIKALIEGKNSLKIMGDVPSIGFEANKIILKMFYEMKQKEKV